MAKVPPQFAKKRPKVQPGSKTPDYAPNAAQDPAMMVARDALVTPKKATPVAKKGMKPC